MKNIDRIRNMNVEEMVKFLKQTNYCDFCAYGDTICQHDMCSQGMKEWLNMESELTQTDIANDFKIYCEGIWKECKHTDCDNCKIDYIVKHFNINNGKITKIEK